MAGGAVADGESWGLVTDQLGSEDGQGRQGHGGALPGEIGFIFLFFQLFKTFFVVKNNPTFRELK